MSVRTQPGWRPMHRMPSASRSTAMHRVTMFRALCQYRTTCCQSHVTYVSLAYICSTPVHIYQVVKWPMIHIPWMFCKDTTWSSWPGHPSWARLTLTRKSCWWPQLYGCPCPCLWQLPSSAGVGEPGRDTECENISISLMQVDYHVFLFM